MKKTLFTIILISIFFSCSNDESTSSVDLNIQLTQCIPSGLQSNLIAFYPFSNGSLDDVSNSNDLTNLTTASPTTDRDGNIDCAYKFESINNEYLTTTNTAFLDNLSEFSISLWYNATSNGVLVSRDDIDLHCPDTIGQWSIRLFELAQPVFSHLNSVHEPSEDLNNNINNWHHLVITYNELNNTLSIYRNGVLKDTDTGIADCGNNPPTVQDIGDLFFGKFNGKLDDIGIFNVELTQSNISLLYETEPCCE
ncbi:LamG domain-containing protein [Psychroserpens jangbogonensis]|uniref:LamG domain-containing protein n=1 Tax=Psychroserpens jangbogonensis TaxID=1484460 RepID=UPI00053CFC42|nr:LamG domain-containing protein [Psychroserpens jangbogonensis]